MKLELKSAIRIPQLSGPVVLVVMDGVGIGSGGDGDAVTRSSTPTLDQLTEEASFRTIRAHGTSVGLPDDNDMGNSEVGHNAMGAGRIIEQGARLVNQALETGKIFRSEAWKTIESRSTDGGALHLIGLLSDGNVHSHEKHLHAILRAADTSGLREVDLHVLIDGRDVPETSALTYVDRLEAVLEGINRNPERRYRIASGGGRMTTTMDRYENDWPMVERGFQAQVHGKGRQFVSAREAIETFRKEEPGIIDQYLPTFVIGESGEPVAPMKDGDSVVLYNFRGDRALELCRAFDDESFDKFDRGSVPDLFFSGLTLYDAESGIPRNYLVTPPAISRTMSEYLAGSGVPQYAVSETQKFGHMTYFWNGNRSGMFNPELETYEEVASDKVPFDQAPAMKAAEIADAVIAALKTDRHRFLRLNFANGDMVGHTGNLEATITSMEAMDRALARVLEAVKEARGTLVLTADHGNAEEMIELDKAGNPKRRDDGTPEGKTAHTTNPVGFWIYRAEGPQLELRQDLPDAGLANLAATVIELLGFEPPEDYQPSLLV